MTAASVLITESSLPRTVDGCPTSFNWFKSLGGVARAMTIFKETLDEEFLTVAEVKELLADLEEERALDEERELPYELARTIEHVNRFAVLEPAESRELVEKLKELEKVDEETAHKIADLLPRARNEVRAVFAQQRYSLDGDELDAVLDVVAQYV